MLFRSHILLGRSYTGYNNLLLVFACCLRKKCFSLTICRWSVEPLGPNWLGLCTAIISRIREPMYVSIQLCLVLVCIPTSDVSVRGSHPVRRLMFNSCLQQQLAFSKYSNAWLRRTVWADINCPASGISGIMRSK